MKSLSTIEIKLDAVKEGLYLSIDARNINSLFDAGISALENNEARFQLVEGCYYDYTISQPEFTLEDIGENIIQQHKRSPNLGTIAPNIFTGTLLIPILDKVTLQKQGTVELEVQSIKTGYRNDYRDMLELITEKCTGLLLQANSPVSQNFEIDHSKDSETLYQKFSFIKSVVGTNEFSEAVHRIVTSPVTRWMDISESKDIRNSKRFTNKNIKDILKGSIRTKLSENHSLKNYGFDTIPERITAIRKADSVDTPENRFIKHALEIFLKFCTDINSIAKDKKYQKIINESEVLIRELENHLHHSIFKNIARPTTLKLNSPVLQRKEGYREVLRVWLMFDLAAKLIWKGGDDVYAGGKKDIATLYEYWLFFKLLELFQNIFEIEPKEISELIQETKDGLNLQIKQGKFTALTGTYIKGNRKLNIRFNYNRSFSGSKDYPNPGSWTTTLRPDYTLSFWPFGIKENDAENQELIVHIHFDAKYKVANLKDFLDKNAEVNLDEEKIENRKGNYKNADLLKMHAYKDAIRRTGGAYVLYPGDESINQKGFHEIIPGLGAFPIKPSKKESGIGELKAFIIEIIEHFENRTSQREKISFKTFNIYKNPPDPKNDLRESFPESFNKNRNIIPDESFVLVGYYHSSEQYEWIKKNKLYNFRMGKNKGSLVLDFETLSSKFLLLHGPKNNASGDLWKIVSKGPKVYSKEDLNRMGYPLADHDNYLIIELAKDTYPELVGVKWDFKKLKNYSSGKYSSFTASLSELMRNKKK